MRALQEGHADGIPQVGRWDALFFHLVLGFDVIPGLLIEEIWNLGRLVEQVLDVLVGERDAGVLHGLGGQDGTRFSIHASMSLDNQPTARTPTLKHCGNVPFFMSR